LPVGKDRTEGGDGGYRYAKTFDPFVPMTAAAAATTTLKVATGVCLVPQRDPIHTAKEVATVDVLFDGRVILGVGAGWNRQEMRNQQDAGQSGGRHDDEREPNGVPCSAPPAKAPVSKAKSRLAQAVPLLPHHERSAGVEGPCQ
jgi:hypothetical protein